MLKCFKQSLVIQKERTNTPKNKAWWSQKGDSAFPRIRIVTITVAKGHSLLWNPIWTFLPFLVLWDPCHRIQRKGIILQPLRVTTAVLNTVFMALYESADILDTDVLHQNNWTPHATLMNWGTHSTCSLMGPSTPRHGTGHGAHTAVTLTAAVSEGLAV